MKSYLGKSFSLSFRHPFDSRHSRGCLKLWLGNLLSKVYFSWYLPARTANVIKPNRSCYYVQKGHGFRENLASVIVSIFFIFIFVDQLLLVDVFCQLYYVTYAKKTTMSDLPL